MRELSGIYIIWLRDVKKFLRDRPRIIGSVAQPALFLFVLGTGLASSFQVFGSNGGKDFLYFMYPGIIAMTVLFTSFFSAMSIIWDREFGFLKEVLISPISRVSIVLGKNFGGSTIAIVQGSIILLFAPILKVPITFLSVIKLIPVMFITAMAISSLGIALASRLKTMQGFQALTNFFLMPMFFLSGALFPLKNAPQWMIFMARINPLSFGVDAMRYVLTGDSTLQLFPFYIDIIVIVGIIIAMTLTGIFLFRKQE
jgi:ABC-2 type transport system permease protein